jgi:hypothetical protein
LKRQLKGGEEDQVIFLEEDDIRSLDEIADGRQEVDNNLATFDANLAISGPSLMNTPGLGRLCCHFGEKYSAILFLNGLLTIKTEGGAQP